MQRSLFLARLLGPLFIVIAVGMLANQGLYHAMIGEFLESDALIYLSGLLSLVAGLAIVNVHNCWAVDWRLIITILGWLMVIGGVIRIVLPRVVVGIGMTIYGPPAAIIVVAVVALVLGAFLSWKGYVAGAV
jgi:hypothetical protein